MDFAAHWKLWIRPLASVLYFILMMIAIPLCIVELTNKTTDGHVRAWFIGGVFVLLAVPISFWEIINHVINYTQPHLQKYIIRIIWMVPIYALNAWFALRFKEAAIYLDTLRECYEAYVIYNFMAYLLSYLWTAHPQLALELSKKPQQRHLIPFCWCPPWAMGSKIIDTCKHGVLQYTIIRPTTTIIALICAMNNKYDEGDFNFKSAWSYLTIINNLSQIWAMYCLVLFYQATKDLLAPIKPIPKFLCVKFVVFFSFWQAVVIAALAKLNMIPHSEFYGNDVKDISTAIQDFCICIEMFIAAIAHYLSFSHKPFIDESGVQGNCCVAFASMWDISDVKDDVVEHVKVVGTTMKKTVSGPFRTRPANSERTPLLQEEGSSRDDTVEDLQVTKADIHPGGGYQGHQSDILSSTSDWEVTSVDRWTPRRNLVSQSTTSSMNNYLDAQSIQSNPIDRSGDTDSRGRMHPSDTDSNYLDAQSIQSNPMERSGNTDSRGRNHPSDTDSRTDKLGSDSDSVSLKGENKSENLEEDDKSLIDFTADANSEDVADDEAFVDAETETEGDSGDVVYQSTDNANGDSKETDKTDQAGNAVC